MTTGRYPTRTSAPQGGVRGTSTALAQPILAPAQHGSAGPQRACLPAADRDLPGIGDVLHRDRILAERVHPAANRDLVVAQQTIVASDVCAHVPAEGKAALGTACKSAAARLQCDLEQADHVAVAWTSSCERRPRR